MTQSTILWPDSEASYHEFGGKAAALKKLYGLNIPAWFVVTPQAFKNYDGDFIDGIETEIKESLEKLGGNLFAVRSSAKDEDGSQFSFAGQLESYLGIEPLAVPEYVRKVYLSAFSERLKNYRNEHQLGDCVPPTILVQRFINADSAGVAFSVDPVGCRWDKAIVSAVPGLGEALVDGSSDADTWEVDRKDNIVDTKIAIKKISLKYQDGKIISNSHENGACLNEPQIIQVSQLAKLCSQHFGRPQDIEWAFENGELFLLQSRAITTLMQNADSDARANLWDCSNIAESYGGITTPLTYSFARDIYEAVYQQFCKLMGVSTKVINEQSEAFRGLLGCMNGRIYYNLINWYRLLSFFPGYQINQAFMEQMMGVSEGLPEDLKLKNKSASSNSKVINYFRFSKSLIGLLSNHFLLSRQIKKFYARLNHALQEPEISWTTMSPDELCDEYRRLEKALLLKWDAPLVNDFFAMIFYGVLKKQCENWLDDKEGTLQNDLIGGDGSVISAEPARRVREMANLAKQTPNFANCLREGSLKDIFKDMDDHNEFKEKYHDYQLNFSDRCLEELKLESLTLKDDPLPLLRAIGHYAARQDQPAENHAAISRQKAEQAVSKILDGQKLKHIFFNMTLKLARSRVANRENLRFERTRLFGRIRKIFVELGKRYASANLLDHERDIFYLDKEEALGFVEGTISCPDIRALANTRKQSFLNYEQQPEPSERFITRGWVFCGNDFTQQQNSNISEEGLDSNQRKGIGCCPGTVRGEVRVVKNPRGVELPANCILVAERTDPGWIMLFPAASGLVVERGSLLSHSAIVSRELGLPAAVAVPNATTWLKDGDVVELNGATGTVTIISTEEKA